MVCDLSGLTLAVTSPISGCSCVELWFIVLCTILHVKLVFFFNMHMQPEDSRQTRLVLNTFNTQNSLEITSATGFFCFKKGLGNVYLNDCEQRMLFKNGQKYAIQTNLCELNSLCKNKLYGHQTRPGLLTVWAAVLLQYCQA